MPDSIFTARLAPINLILAACAAAPVAHAQESTPEPPSSYETRATEPYTLPPPRETTSDWQVRIDAWQRFMLSADIDDGGDVSISRSNLGVSFSGPVAERLNMRFGVAGEFSSYDFDGNLDLTPDGSRPFREVLQVDVFTDATYSLDESWNIIAQARIRFAGEPDAKVSRSILGGGFIGAEHIISPDLRIGGGILIQSRLEDDTRFLPFFTVNWRVNERLRIFSRGLGATAAYALTDELTAAGSVWWESREFRLEDDGPVRRGVGRDERVLAGVELAWRPSPTFTVGAEVGAALWQRFEVLDSSGDRVSRSEADPAPFLGLRLQLRF